MPIQTSLITGTRAHTHSGTEGGSDGGSLGVQTNHWLEFYSSSQASELIMDYNETIGDYTSPTSATCSSAAVASPTYDNSNFGAWSTTGTQVTESSNIVSFNIQTRLNNQTVSCDLGSALSDTTWLMRCKLDFTTLTTAGASTIFLAIGMGSASSSTPLSNSGIGLDMIALQEYSGTGVPDEEWGLVGYNNTGPLDNPASPIMDTDPVTGTSYYLEIIRTSATQMSIGLYSDAAFTTLIMPVETKTILAGVTGLQYLRVGNGDVGSESSPGNVIEGTIQNFQIWDNTTTPNSLCANAVDDNTATVWESASEVNPNIYVDFGSSTQNSNVALYPNADTTSTEIKLQSSDDALSWSDLRTITYSELTNGAWNFIRFQLDSFRYMRVYGSNAGASVLALNEIKYITVTDTQVRNGHAHLSISPTDTDLNLDGT